MNACFQDKGDLRTLLHQRSVPSAFAQQRGVDAVDLWPRSDNRQLADARREVATDHQPEVDSELHVKLFCWLVPRKYLFVTKQSITVGILREVPFASCWGRQLENHKKFFFWKIVKTWNSNNKRWLRCWVFCCNQTASARSSKLNTQNVQPHLVSSNNREITLESHLNTTYSSDSF